MANTRALVQRRKSVRNTRKITKTMQMVSTAKLAKASAAAIAARPYATKLQQVIGDLAKNSADVQHPLLEDHTPAKKAVIVLFTSDRGLCGGYNSNTIKLARVLAADIKARGLEVEWVVQGKKGVGSLRYAGITPVKTYLLVSDKPAFTRAEEIGDELIRRFTNREIDEAYIVYSMFKSMTTQVPKSEKILPLSSMAVAVAGKDGVGKIDGAGGGFIFEPDAMSILSEVLPNVVKMSIFTAMLDSTAGEHAARRLAMQNATDAADDMIKALSRAYNRARQSKITQEIAEIVGGAEAL